VKLHQYGRHVLPGFRAIFFCRGMLTSGPVDR
jgi:hypothetical protein